MTSIPLIDSFWFMIVAYVIHILDESLLGGSFVDKVRQHWWPQYSWGKFFWFNTGYLIIMSASVVLYDRLGEAFLFLPIACAIERFLNGVWHVWWSIHFKEYSPGLLTSLLFWIQTYFICICRPPESTLHLSKIWPGMMIGVLTASFLSFSMPILGRQSGGRTQIRS